MAEPQDLKGVLDGVDAPNSVKADAWDAFHQTQNQAHFKQRFDGLNLPRETKATLWDMKFGGAPAATSAPTAQPQQPSFDTLPGGEHALWGQPTPTPTPTTAPTPAARPTQPTADATISARSGPMAWLEDLEGDIKHGTGATLPGRVLQKMGAPGTASGVPESAEPFIPGAAIAVGPVKAAHGIGELQQSGALDALGDMLGGPGITNSTPTRQVNKKQAIRGANEAISGAMETAAPVAMMDPAFLPSVAPYAIAQPAIQKGAQKLGADPDTAELVSNAALLLPFLRSAFRGSSGSAEGAGVVSPEAAQLAQHVADFRTILNSVGIDLPQNATLDQATSAYKQAMAKVHPDVNPNTAEQASQLNQIARMTSWSGWVPCFS